MSEEQTVLNNVLEKAKTEEKKEEPETEKKKDEQETEVQDVEEVNTEEKTEEDTEEKNDEPETEKKNDEPETAKQDVEKADAKDEPRKPEVRERGRAERNVVLVGKKPTMSYVLAVVTQFSDGINDVHIKARGRCISRAVDVAEVVRNRFIQGASVGVQIGTQEIIDENNNKINVSTIDIKLDK